MLTWLEPPVSDNSHFWVIEGSQFRIGVDSQNIWLLSKGMELRPFSESKDCTPLLPLLETSRMAFFGFLKRVSSLYSALAAIESSFPEKLLLQHALCVSEYWAQKAVDWIREETTLIDGLFNDLNSVSANKLFNQSLRHGAQKLLSQNRRNKKFSEGLHPKNSC